MQRKGQGSKYTLTDCPLCNAWIHKSQDKRSNLRNKLSCVKQLSQNDNVWHLFDMTYDIEALLIRNKDRE